MNSFYKGGKLKKLKDMLNRFKGKVSSPKQHPTVFLRSMHEIASIADKPFSLRVMIRKAERISNHEANISNSSLDNFHKNGFGISTFKKLLTFYRCLNPSIIYEVETFILSKKNESSATFLWAGIVKGVNKFDLPDYELVIDEIKRRIHYEHEFLSYSVNRKLQDEYQGNLVNLISSSTLIKSEDVKFIIECAAKKFNGEKIVLSKKNQQSLLRYNFDFYFTMLVMLEVGILNYWFSCDSQVKERLPLFFEKGIFSQLITANDESLPFDKYFRFIKNIHLNKDISFREICKFIPLETELQDIEDINEIKRQTLKNWRKGKDYPSREKLEEFLISLHGARHQGTEGLVVIGEACVFMSKYYQKLCTDKTLDKDLLDHAFSDYQRYWQTYSKKHLRC